MKPESQRPSQLALPHMVICLLGLVLWQPQTSWAQTAPQAPQLTPRDLRPTQPDRPAPALPSPAPADVPDQADKLFVQVQDVQVEGGFEELKASTEVLLTPLRAQRVSVARFYELAEAIETLYREAGWLLVRVVVPPQSLKDGGTLRLVVLDGFIERLDVTAVPELARSRVEAVLHGLVKRRRLSSDALERALTLAGRGPGLSMRSTMGAGTQAGGVVLVLEGEFARTSVNVSVDNKLSKSVGPWQHTTQATLNEPFGQGLQAYTYVSGGFSVANAFRSTAARRVAGGGLIIPVGVDGLSFNPEITWSDSQPPAQPGAPRSRSRLDRATFRVSYPWLLNRQQEVTLNGAFEVAKQRDTYPDFNYTLSRDSLRVARLGASWNTTLPTQARLFVSSTLSQGIADLGARSRADIAASGVPMSRAGATPGFRKLEASMTYEQALPWGLQYKLGLRMQQALQGVLPSTEVFSLGGDDALSMLPGGAVSSDSGWTWRNEVARAARLELGNAPVSLLPYLFSASGRVRSKVANASTDGENNVYGLGMRGGWQQLNLSMEYGHAFSAVEAVSGSRMFVKAQVQF